MGWKPLGPRRPAGLQDLHLLLPNVSCRSEARRVETGKCVPAIGEAAKLENFFVCMSDRRHTNRGVTPRFFFGTDADVANRKSGADAYTAPCIDFTVSLSDVPRNWNLRGYRCLTCKNFKQLA